MSQFNRQVTASPGDTFLAPTTRPDSRSADSAAQIAAALAEFTGKASALGETAVRLRRREMDKEAERIVSANNIDSEAEFRRLQEEGVIPANADPFFMARLKKYTAVNSGRRASLQVAQEMQSDPEVLKMESIGDIEAEWERRIAEFDFGSLDRQDALLGTSREREKLLGALIQQQSANARSEMVFESAEVGYSLVTAAMEERNFDPRTATSFAEIGDELREVFDKLPNDANNTRRKAITEFAYTLAEQFDSTAVARKALAQFNETFDGETIALSETSWGRSVLKTVGQRLDQERARQYQLEAAEYTATQRAAKAEALRVFNAMGRGEEVEPDLSVLNQAGRDLFEAELRDLRHQKLAREAAATRNEKTEADAAESDAFEDALNAILQREEPVPSYEAFIALDSLKDFAPLQKARLYGEYLKLKESTATFPDMDPETALSYTQDFSRRAYAGSLTLDEEVLEAVRKGYPEAKVEALLGLQYGRESNAVSQTFANFNRVLPERIALAVEQSLPPEFVRDLGSMLAQKRSTAERQLAIKKADAETTIMRSFYEASLELQTDPEFNNLSVAEKNRRIEETIRNIVASSDLEIDPNLVLPGATPSGVGQMGPSAPGDARSGASQGADGSSPGSTSSRLRSASDATVDILSFGIEEPTGATDAEVAASEAANNSRTLRRTIGVEMLAELGVTEAVPATAAQIAGAAERIGAAYSQYIEVQPFESGINPRRASYRLGKVLSTAMGFPVSVSYRSGGRYSDGRGTYALPEDFVVTIPDNVMLTPKGQNRLRSQATRASIAITRSTEFASQFRKVAEKSLPGTTGYDRRFREQIAPKLDAMEEEVAAIHDFLRRAEQNPQDLGGSEGYPLYGALRTMFGYGVGDVIAQQIEDPEAPFKMRVFLNEEHAYARGRSYATALGIYDAENIAPFEEWMNTQLQLINPNLKYDLSQFR